MKISVFITSYNQKEYLAEAIESVLNQTWHPSQIIIIDDYSEDGSQELIAGYASRYSDLILPIYNTRNIGVAQCRILALEAVTGEKVTYVDGDDRFLPTKLEKEGKALEKHSTAHIAFSNNYYMTKDGQRKSIWADGVVPPEGKVFLDTFARDYPRGSLFRMELVDYNEWKRIGFHDPSLNLYEDFDMRIRLTKSLRTVYCDEPLSEIRMHGQGLASSKAQKHLLALEYLFKKNRCLLNDVSDPERRKVESSFKEFLARVAKKAAREMLEKEKMKIGSRKEAMKYYLLSLKYGTEGLDPILISKLCLPRSFYKCLATTYYRVRYGRCVFPN